MWQSVETKSQASTSRDFKSTKKQTYSLETIMLIVKFKIPDFYSYKDYLQEIL